MSKRKNTSSLNRRAALKAIFGTAAASGVIAPAAKADEKKPDLVRIGKRNRPPNPIKQRAANDYANSLSAFGGRLSSPIRELFLTAQNEECVHFGVAVIGSGYGSSVMAARLSQRLHPDHRICVLERGKEWVPGTFPDTFLDVKRNSTVGISGPAKGKLLQPLGLYNLMMNDEVNILAGNGLGGGSLINSSICLRPHPNVFEKERWPKALNQVEVLGPYYDRFAAGLSVTRSPVDQTPKIRTRRRASEQMSSSECFFDLSNLSVMYDYRYLDDHMRNPQRIVQRPCTLCGDCNTGCNIGAKNTLPMNFLPVARHNGTEMFTQVEVKSIEKRCGYYRIHMEYIDDSNHEITRHPVSVNSRIVVVGAGSPSSAAILLDSQSDDFCFSPLLGRNWSGNGDTIGFAIDLPPGTNIGGFGAEDPSCHIPVGPSGQTSLNYHYNEAELRKRLTIQEASIPSAVRPVLRILLRDRELDKSMIMLGMGHDGANGRLVKSKGRWKIKWDGLKESAYRKMVFAEFERLAAAHGGTYKRLKAFGDNLVTVHPLGGCGMSDDPNGGATNHLGQVFDFAGGGYIDGRTDLPAVHEGLYVADGSVIPTALGVNPFMTIGALAERTAAHILHDPMNRDLFG